VTGILQNHRLHEKVRMRKFSPALLPAVAALYLLLSASAAANELSAIRHWSSPTSTRIVLDFRERAAYKTVPQPDPDKLVLDITGIAGAVPVSTVLINDGIVKTVTAARRDRDTIRITVELTRPASHKIFSLEKFMDKPPRLAIDIIRPDLEQADKVERQQTRKLKQKQVRIVVIDAGHGGEDPGAIGPGKTMEKDIVLAIARKTAQLLNRAPDIKAYLTRKGDYFIPLGTRMNMAQEHGADLFISIHADSSFSSKIQGTSIYCLSLKGASSAAALKLAQKENASDSVGGVPLEQHNDDLNAILVDLVQTNTLNASLKCAGSLLQEIARFNRLRMDQPQQAGFKVLKDPDITSVLIETDFLSNPRSEQRLKSEQFQNSFAAAIAAAVTRFFPAAPPPAAGGQPAREASAPKAGKKSPATRLHTVARGESLDTIAKKYGMTAARLKALNGLSEKSTIRAGMKLKIAKQ
jgi:N-acetylmuramoyl-L-alanine amidase